MKILLIHTKYQYKGGEDSVFEEEKKLLESRGHKVVVYLQNNKEVKNYSFFQKLLFPFNTVYSLRTYRELSKIIKKEKPDIAHFHNTFPVISPSAYYACRKHKVKIVQTLHNFRLLCPNAMFIRDNKVCELCLKNNNPFIAVKYKCYRKSRILTLVLSSMLFIHKKTFRNVVDNYIALTEFNKQKFIEGGFSRDKIHVKPNFIDSTIKPSFGKEDYAIFLGRLETLKGIDVIVEAWKDINFKLEVYGEGDLENYLEKNPNITYHGLRPVEECVDKLRKARFLIIASTCYEGFPRTIVEAFSVGTPILSSKIGNMSTIIEEGKTGKFFTVSDVKDLKKKIIWMINHKKECEEMGRNAYKEYLDKYTSDKNYNDLIDIYKKVLNPKILLVHDKYITPGGEDSMFDAEKKMLEYKGHKVISYIRDNKETKKYNYFQTFMFPFNTIFSLKTYFRIKKLIKKEKPDVAYIHNTFPVISPSVYYACKKYDLPVIQRLPNYRFVCPNAYLFRNNKVCELCLDKNNPFIGVKYNCYRKSKILTFIIALMIKIHRGTYIKKIDFYVPNSEIVRQKFIKAKYPIDKLIHKPNFTEGLIKPEFKKEDFAIYVGRLSVEKGVKTLVEAWKDIDFPLEVYGSGPLSDMLKGNTNIKYYNQKSSIECINRIRAAKFLIFSSEWEETFGISMIEAFSVGTPVLASRMGNMKYVVEEGKTGKFFIPGDSSDLRDKALWLISHPKECEEMGKNTYEEYKKKYTPEVNYANLIKIFNKAIQDAKNR